MASSIVPAGHQVFANTNSGRSYIPKVTQLLQLDVVGLSTSFKLPVTASRVGDQVTLMVDEIFGTKNATAGTLTIAASAIPASLRPTAGITFTYVMSVGGAYDLGSGFITKEGGVTFQTTPAGGTFAPGAVLRSYRFAITYSLITSNFRA